MRSIESFEPERELQLEEEPRRKKAVAKPEGYKLPSREEIEGGGYNIKEIFGELRAGGKKEIDNEHERVLIFDRHGEPMADIPFKEYDLMIEAAEKMIKARADEAFHEGEHVMREWEKEIDSHSRRMRGGELEH